MEVKTALQWSLITTGFTCFLGWSRDQSKGKMTSYTKAIRSPLVGIILGSILYPYFSEPVPLGLTSAICERWLMLSYKSVYAFYYPKYKFS
jgi:hypothetical protein